MYREKSGWLQEEREKRFVEDLNGKQHTWNSRVRWHTASFSRKTAE